MFKSSMSAGFGLGSGFSPSFVDFVPVTISCHSPCKAVLAYLTLLCCKDPAQSLPVPRCLVSLSVVGSRSHWGWAEGRDTQGFAAAVSVGR